MKELLMFVVLLILGCQSNSIEANNEFINSDEELFSDKLEKFEEGKNHWRDSLYYRECDNYISKLEEISGRDSNAYKLTILSKKDNQSFFKILNARPRASSIKECNDYYTVVGFSCGGPCTSKIFVFTDKNRPIEQYYYAHIVNDLPTIILYIKNEEFQNLIIRNLLNGKEIIIKNSDIQWQSYGQMNKFYVVGNELMIEYLTENETTREKTIPLQKILN